MAEILDTVGLNYGGFGFVFFLTLLEKLDPVFYSFAILLRIGIESMENCQTQFKFAAEIDSFVETFFADFGPIKAEYGTISLSGIVFDLAMI